MDFTNIRIVALDLDGTLETSDHQISPRTAQAIKNVIDHGIIVIIATGKTYFAGERVRKRLQLNTPSVHVQGLALYKSNGEILHENHMPIDTAQEVLAIIQDNDVDSIVNSGNRILATKRTKWTDLIEKYGEPAAEVVESLADHPIQKITAIGIPAKIKALKAQLSLEISGKANLVQSNLGNMIEVLPLGTSKGEGVRRVLHHLGIAPNQLLAFGDGENDLEMLELASIGVAMGNAEDALKNSADLVTATNDEDGVAIILEQLIAAF